MLLITESPELNTSDEKPVSIGFVRVSTSFFLLLKTSGTSGMHTLTAHRHICLEWIYQSIRQGVHERNTYVLVTSPGRNIGLVILECYVGIGRVSTVFRLPTGVMASWVGLIIIIVMGMKYPTLWIIAGIMFAVNLIIAYACRRNI
jgi:hypothetical protein